MDDLRDKLGCRDASYLEILIFIKIMDAMGSAMFERQKPQIQERREKVFVVTHF